MRPRLRLRPGRRRPARHHADRGAVAVVTALITSTVLVGAALIAVDVGGLYDEHRQVRNGADAAALALARVCSAGLTTNKTDPCAAAKGPTGVAARVADDNAADGDTRIERLCGTAPGLSVCPLPRVGASPLSACPPPVTSTGTYGSPTYVEARTATGTTDGRNAYRPAFGDAAGADGDDVVRSCARAAYGTPSSMHTVVPFAISRCVLERYLLNVGITVNGSAGVSALSSSARSKAETTIALDAGVNIGIDCLINISIGISFSGQGNFAFLGPASGSASCSADTAAGVRVGAFYANANLNATCAASMNQYLGQTVYVPVYDPDKTTGSRTNGSVAVSGYAAFYITGYNLNGKTGTVSGSSVPCQSKGLFGTTNSPCLRGVFVNQTTSVGVSASVGGSSTGSAAGDADQYGVSQISLAG